MTSGLTGHRPVERKGRRSRVGYVNRVESKPFNLAASASASSLVPLNANWIVS